MKKLRLKGKNVCRIVVVKAKFSAPCAGEDCDYQIEQGSLCHAQRPGEIYYCPSCAAKRHWPPIDQSKFVDPLKASKQAAEGISIKRKHREQSIDKDS